MITKLDAKSAAMTRGLSDLSIRNLFIIPTIAFLIIFNIFPLIYSLGYSFYDYSAAGSAPPVFVGLGKLQGLAVKLLHLEQFFDHSKICDRLGRRPDARRLRHRRSA